METTETAQIPTVPPAAATPVPEFQHCDACGAPVDHEQRYCVSCGAHRRNVPDPAARYLSQAGARSRAVKRTAARPSAARRPGAGLAVAAVLALIPVAAVVGIEVGRSDSNAYTKALQAADRAQPKTVYTEAPPTSSAAVSRHSATKASKSHKAAAKKGAKKTSTASGGGKVASTTQYGSATQITGSKVTASQVQQGAAEANKIQNSTGKNYVNAASNLPSTVDP